MRGGGAVDEKKANSHTAIIKLLQEIGVKVHINAMHLLSTDTVIILDLLPTLLVAVHLSVKLPPCTLYRDS